MKVKLGDMDWDVECTVTAASTTWCGAVYSLPDLTSCNMTITNVCIYLHR